MSNSIFTLSPIFNTRILVFSSVIGIIHSSNKLPSVLLTVKLTPLMVTEPLYTAYLEKEGSKAMVTNHAVIKPKHPIQPFGTVTATNYTDWTTDTAVQNAALMISVEIWQARTATLSGSNAVDFQPSPYRMSAQLIAKVRGLIAHALAPTSMVG